MKPVLRFLPDSGWEEIAVREYKAEGTHFRDITRRVLFGAEQGLACELRYFEIAPGGHSTLERHDHPHAVVVLRGRGHVLVGREVHAVEGHDLVSIPSGTLHQFRATSGEPLGFLCLVNCERDRPLRPDAAELAELRADPAVRDFIRS